MIDDKLLKTITQECLECRQEFIPDESGQECCSNECASVYYEWDAHWTEDHCGRFDDYDEEE